MSFVHLHVHYAEGSLLDGCCRISDTVRRAKEMGQTALAITDHGAMYGTVDFYRACQKEGIKPIIGCEVYLAPRSRKQRIHGVDDRYFHLVLLCENKTGYMNLCYMVSEAFLTGFYSKPRIDKEMLKEHHDGLIALSGCLSGEIPKLLLGEDEEQPLVEADYFAAKKAALDMSEIFGPNHFYLEMQDHGIRSQQKVNNGIRRIAAETGLPMVITNDAHYMTKEDSKIQEILLCLATQKTLNEPHMKFDTNEFYLKSEKELRQLFPNDFSAFDNTVKIADMCNFDFEFGHYHLPNFEPPKGYSNDSYFEKLCWDGYRNRYPNGTDADKAQMEYEISVIKKMGYVNYFLIVADYINWAKNHNIPVGPGRGSAAGSMVSYCMYITDIDPREYTLHFERFLNPERVSMPDIDVDFCVNRRQEVIDYVTEKYGKENVAQIITFGTMKAKGAVRDIGRVLGVPYKDVDAIARMIPNDTKITLDSALTTNPELKRLYETNATVKQIIDIAKRVEGIPRNASTHAAAVVIASAPVYEFVPLAKGEGSLPVIQYNMVTVEELGLLKMDFLGLRNLTVIDDTEQLIRRKEPNFSIQNIDFKDPAVYNMLSQGKTSGVFQLESSGITSVCIDLQPQSIEDLTAIVSLYRPGPMDSIPTFVANKRNPAKIQYITPKLEPIISVTYGCMVYQEQVMDVFRNLAGYSLGQADNIRRAISKKKQKVIEEERIAFVSGDIKRNIPGAIRNGISAETANKIYDDIVDFASYAFNKSHAVCYAYVSYQTAYLKCHYPVEYMAALMSSVLEKPDKLSSYILQCRETNIKVLPPNINISESKFLTDGDMIRFPLNAIKGIGQETTDEIIKIRKDGFANFEDFIERTFSICRSTDYKGLIQSGALDCLGLKRSQMLQSFEIIISTLTKQRQKNISGQMRFEDISEEIAKQDQIIIPDIPEFKPRELFKMEKEAMGVYVSGHPLDIYKHFVGSAITVADANKILEELPNGKGYSIEINAIINDIKEILTKRGQMIANIHLEDSTGTIEAIEFTSAFEKYRTMQKIDMAVRASGRLSKKNGNTTFAISTLTQLDRIPILENCDIQITVPNNQKIIDQIMECIKSGSVGPTFVSIFIKKDDGTCAPIDKGYRTLNMEVMTAIEKLVGSENIGAAWLR